MSRLYYSSFFTFAYAHAIAYLISDCHFFLNILIYSVLLNVFFSKQFFVIKNLNDAKNVCLLVNALAQIRD